MSGARFVVTWFFHTGAIMRHRIVPRPGKPHIRLKGGSR